MTFKEYYYLTEEERESGGMGLGTLALGAAALGGAGYLAHTGAIPGKFGQSLKGWATKAGAAGTPGVDKVLPLDPNLIDPATRTTAFQINPATGLPFPGQTPVAPPPLRTPVVNPGVPQMGSTGNAPIVQTPVVNTGAQMGSTGNAPIVQTPARTGPGITSRTVPGSDFSPELRARISNAQRARRVPVTRP